MARLTTNLEIASRPKKNGNYPIYIRITENGKHYKQILDVYVSDKKNFNAHAKLGTWINAKEPFAKVFNSKIESTLNKVHKDALSLEQNGMLSASNLLERSKGGNSESLIDFIDRHCEKYLECKEFANRQRALSLKKLLLKYNNGRDVLFSQLNYRFVSGFVQFLKKPYKRDRYYADSTIFGLFNKLKTFYNEAILEQLIPENQVNPFRTVKLKSGQAHRIGLTTEELDRIINLNLESGSALWHARNYFLFSVYMAGIRISDILTIKWENVIDDHLKYKMKKTKMPVSIPIFDRPRAILDLYRTGQEKPTDYIFPLLTKYVDYNATHNVTELQKYHQRSTMRAYVNYQLVKIAKLAKIDKPLTFHIARHTFAHIAAQSKNSNVVLISHLLGHSSIAITQTYLNGISNERQDAFLKSIF